MKYCASLRPFRLPGRSSLQGPSSEGRTSAFDRDVRSSGQDTPALGSLRRPRSRACPPDPAPIASGLFRLRRCPDQRSEELPVRFASKNKLIAWARGAPRGNGDKERQRAAGDATHFGRGAGLTIVQFDLGHVAR